MSQPSSPTSPLPITRRQWISRMGLCMVSAAVPAGLISCGDPIEQPDTQSGDPLDSELLGWIDRLEDKSIYDRLEPGKWIGLESTHLPILTFHNQLLEVTLYTHHVMTETHSIELQYLKDQDQNLIGARRYSAQDPFARATFKIPEGTTEVSAYSYCNLHGLWISAGIT